MQQGDLAVLYAAVWQALYGVVEVTGPPEHDPARDRWSWRFPIAPVAVVTDLEAAPPVEAAGIFPQSLWRHSHIRLSPEQFETARALVEGASPALGAELRRSRDPASTMRPLQDPKQIVARGYDAIALRYAEWAAATQAPTMEWVRDLVDRLPSGSEVLDLGCGRGVPATRELAKQHRVTGVDISRAQIELARHHVPEATFLHADAAAVELPPGAFDAVVSLYMLGHVPRAEQGPLLTRIRGWLKPGGWFLGTMGIGDADDAVEDDWLGAPMFFSSFDEPTNRDLVRGAGLEIDRERVIEIDEPGHGPVSFMWLLARSPT